MAKVLILLYKWHFRCWTPTSLLSTKSVNGQSFGIMLLSERKYEELSINKRKVNRCFEKCQINGKYFLFCL